ncbi:MAG: hypothetical protein AAF636_06665 [Pseudomonadota bacterium]
MLLQIKKVTDRAEATMVQDLAGGAALVVILVVGLYLPGFF